MENNLTKIQDYLAMSEDQLFSELGGVITQGTLNANDSPEKKLKLGKNWFLKNQDDIFKKLCENESVKKIIESENLSLGLNIASMLVPFVESIVLPGLSLIVSCMISKQGLKNICKDKWEAKP